MSTTIAARIKFIRQLITETLANSDKKENIRLIAVSKGQSISAIQAAYDAGITDFAENYWQEAQKKISSLNHLPICWHFIGKVQSNKAALIANHFAWIHSISCEKKAQLLSHHRFAHLPSLNVCIQLNLDNEPGKQGIAPSELVQLANSIILLPKLKLRGLMAMPKLQKEDELHYQSLLRLTNLYHDLNDNYSLKLDCLSMGTSDDMQAAIRAGSTMIRLGRAIFGAR